MTRKCPKCNEERSGRNFRYAGKENYGEQGEWCSTCITHKVCRKCEIRLPIEEFRLRYDTTGRSPRCKKCTTKRHSKNSKSSLYTLNGKMKRLLYGSQSHSVKNDYANNISLDDLLSCWNKQGGKCAITGLELSLGEARKNPMVVSLDRIDSSKGYTVDNIHLIIWWVDLFTIGISEDLILIMAFMCHKIQPLKSD